MTMAFCAIGITNAIAQWRSFSNLKTKSFSTLADTILVNDSFIIPSSLFIENVNDSCYLFDSDLNRLIWKNKCPKPNFIKVTYRKLPSQLIGPYSLSQYQKDSNFVFPIYNNETLNSVLSPSNGLNFSGAYSRSVNVGNTQNLNLNSNFNMQMSGYLIDSIKVEGAITDNNVPFQPEGNTQRIQEFDRVYISLEKDRHKLTLGDFSLEKPSSYFLNFQKRVQGISYQIKNLKYGAITHSSTHSISVSKGQFARNIFNGIEGNQGPYKLRSNNGEQFFIILAGTEKVYIDGILLSRGEDRDYIINYNLGEIIFMPRILITKDKRIQVEFEYQDRNYLNSLIFTQNDFLIKEKWKINLNIYSNQDAKNQPFLQELNDDQRKILKSVGDNISQAYYNNAYLDTPAQNKILYRMIDTTVGGIVYDSVYEYSNDASLLLYQVSFSYVGENNGDYIISNYNTNGRSYQWLAPIDGKPQGNYQAVSLIITPKQHQVISLASSYRIDSTKIIEAESSLSNYNPNLFATVSTQEHLGMAHRIRYDEVRNFGKTDSNKAKFIWHNELYYEMVQKKFKAIAPFRNVEFHRDWNIIGTDSTLNDEHIGHWSSKLTYQNWGEAIFRFSTLIRTNQYLGFRQELAPTFTHKNYKTGVRLNLLNSKSNVYNTTFWRPSYFLEKKFPKMANTIIGAKYELEDNKVKDATTHLLNPLSYSFDVYNAYIRNEENQVKYAFVYTRRNDRKVRNNVIKDYTQGHTFDVMLSLNDDEDHQLEITGSYRILNVTDTVFSQEKQGTSLVGRVQYNGNLKDNFIHFNLLYEFGSGQEQKRAFTFVEVPIGQGFYYWVDYNNDGIQQANEFEIGIYPDQKRYVKIITPTNEYSTVNFNQYNFSLDINPAMLSLKSKNALWLNKIQNTISINGNSRLLQSAGLQGFIPWQIVTHDSNIVTQTLNLLNTLYYNRTNPKFGITYSYLQNCAAHLLTYGVERSGWKRHHLLFRYNFNKNWNTTLQLKSARRSYKSGLDDERTYDYYNLGLNPTLSLIINNRWRISGQYDFDLRKNKPDYGGENALAQSGKMEVRISMNNIGSILVNGSLTHLKFDGDQTSPRAFAILESLRKGNNYIWSLQWDTKLSKSIEMSIQYDGRKPGDLGIIHTGRMSVRALL